MKAISFWNASSTGFNWQCDRELNVRPHFAVSLSAEATSRERGWVGNGNDNGECIPTQAIIAGGVINGAIHMPISFSLCI
jgi:hypothetical protein